MGGLDRSRTLERLRDARSRRVVFLSHCLLNENTRYLGGACHPGCVPEIVERCMQQGLGVVQMPCPEQAAWGGVLKMHLLRLHGHPLLRRIAWIASPLAVAISRRRFRAMARRVASQVADYAASGFEVAGVVGVDGSPSCGVRTTVDLRGALGEILERRLPDVSVEWENALVRRHAQPGTGLFIAELRRELRRRWLEVAFDAHDLLRELDGAPSDALAS